MHTEKGTMRTETIFSDDKKHRYLLRKEWDKKPKACVIMTNPSTASLHKMDYTTLYIINNLVQLDFGAVDIVNMVSKVTTKLDTKEDVKKWTSEDNLKQILLSAEKASKVIVAWGKVGENNKKIRVVQEDLLEQLKPFQEKLYVIGDKSGAVGFHPLAPSIRFHWNLVKFGVSDEKESDKEVKEVDSISDESLDTTDNEIKTEEQNNLETA